MDFQSWLTANQYDADALQSPEMAQQRRHLEAAWKYENAQVAVPIGDDIGAIIASYESADPNAVTHKSADWAELRERAGREGWDAKRTKLEALRLGRTQPAMYPNRGPSAGAMGADILAASLAISAGASETEVGKIVETKVGKMVGGAMMNEALRAENRHTSFHSVVRAILAAHGRHVPTGRITDAHLREVFHLSQAEQFYDMRAEGAPSTYSLPNVLSNAAGKISLAAFNATAVTWPLFCKKVDLADFKQHTSIRLINAGQFKKVPPAGEIKHGSLSEATAAIQAQTYAELLSIDRQSLINDDLSKFSEIPRILGRNSAVRVEKSVYTLLLANTGSFFSSGNKNTATGGGSALALAGLDGANKLFLQGVDANGDPVLIIPEVLLVPPALDATARNLTASQTIVSTTTANAPLPDQNTFAGRFSPLSSAYLSVAIGLPSASDTGWYLLTGAGDFAIIQVGFLNGNAAPIIETGQLEFDRLGLQMRGYLDFDCGFLEPRGGVFSAGV